jgi:drug/metabolite transporter (DMT)-like permease
LSAAGFGAMAIFGKLAYEEGVEVGDLLLVRFALASVLLLGIAQATGALRKLSRRGVLAGLGMGAIGYAAQSGLFFGALERMDASLLALILYTYPALVLVGAVALGRERATARRVAALGVALAGVALVLAGAASGAVDPLGAAMGFAASLVYTVYILVGDRVGAGLPLVALAALVCTGATGTFAVAAAVRGGPELAFGAAGWGWIGCIVLVSTVGAILTFFAGLARVGPSAASILSTLEPVVTVALAAAAFGESLSAIQLAGGALVLSAVVVMQWPARSAAALRDAPAVA